MSSIRLGGIIAIVALMVSGCNLCRKPHITAVSLDPCTFGKETGIPFYLPKPLLIVAKNFRNIEEAKVGLTETVPIPDTWDDQAKYADLNARTNFRGLQGSTQTGGVNGAARGSTNLKSGPHTYSEGGAPITPGVAPSDGLAPDTFFTYQIVFVPDLTQKYGLKIRGGPGEIRAAMNLVNGWQFTGLGPYYMKDSSTSQNILSAGIATRLGGQAVADVLNEVSDLAGAGLTQSGALAADDSRVQRLAHTIQSLPTTCSPMTLTDYAEIHVYEASLGMDGMMIWTEIAQHSFHRDYLGCKSTTVDSVPVEPTTVQGETQSGSLDPIYRKALSQALGLPMDDGGLPQGVTQSGSLQSGSVPGSGVNQIQVDCGKGCGPPVKKEYNLFNFGEHRCKRGRIQSRLVRADPTAFVSMPTRLGGGGETPVDPALLNGGGAGGGGDAGGGADAGGGGDNGGGGDAGGAGESAGGGGLEVSGMIDTDEQKEYARVHYAQPPALR